MGLLNFLKKKQQSTELDVPPAPYQNLDIAAPHELPSMPPDISSLDNAPVQSSDMPAGDSALMMEMPPSMTSEHEQQPYVPKLSEQIPQPPSSLFMKTDSFRPADIPLPPDFLKSVNTEPKIEADAPIPKQTLQKPSIQFEQVHNIHELEGDFSKPMFIDADRYKLALESIADIRRDLSITDTQLSKMTELEAQKERKFHLWQDCLEDIQRKLIFMDKTLFE